MNISNKPRAYILSERSLSEEKIDELRRCRGLASYIDNHDFISGLEFALNVYVSVDQEELSRPKVSVIRAELTEIKASLESVFQAIDNLDTETKHHLCNVHLSNGGNPNEFPLDFDSQMDSLESLHNLQEVIDLSLGGLSGKTVNQQRSWRFLTIQVAQILEGFGISITQTEDGPFNTCLSVISNNKPETTRGWIRRYLSESKGKNNLR